MVDIYYIYDVYINKLKKYIMGLLNFVLLMSVPDMSAMADLEALAIYAVLPMFVGFFILLLFMPDSGEQKNANLSGGIEEKLMSSKNSTEEVAA